MSSPVILHAVDDLARGRALDPSQSFTVQAPAGSGKTELLIQRFLKLLAVVSRPEAIVAITFTRKAAGEMIERVTGALRQAADDTPVTEPHRRITRELARAALARNREKKWDLLAYPGRLRVQTIDSLCLSIVGEMPWLARLGGVPRIEEDATLLYAEAARRTLSDKTPAYSEALTTVLRHLDNNTGQARMLLAKMLDRRDQWLPLVGMNSGEERAELEEALRRSIASALRQADRLVPDALKEAWIASARFAAGILDKAPPAHWPAAEADRVQAWHDLSNLVLTVNNQWRKSITRKHGFPAHLTAQKRAWENLLAALRTDDDLRLALKKVRRLPEPRISDDQWGILQALLRTLHLAAAQLQVTFHERGAIDFVELGAAARQALGAIEDPTDLAFHLDARIEHLLVDEFQDTSRMQFELLEKLTADWQNGDGRTFFIVGDPMQSIYRFRQAEVGLFLNVKENGIGNVVPDALELKLNRRSVPLLVERVEELLEPLFPQQNDPEIGAVRYSRSQSGREESGGEVTFEAFLEEEGPREAESVLRRIQESRDNYPAGSIAILVRARTHLFAIAPALKQAGIPFQAVEIELLEGRTAVRDLTALTKALLNPLDRVAWLAILRAPWCGLDLKDLEALVRDRRDTPIEQCLADVSGLSNLSGDGRQRAERVRDVMTEALAERGRWPLRCWLERTWSRLGGPACLAGDRDALDDTMAFLDLLEREQEGADLPDFGGFHQLLGKLYAKPLNINGPVVQIMTIHKAKGLEFDTVILPGLGRRARGDEAPLILSHEWRDGDKFECLLAPMDETGAEKSALYRYVSSLEKRKNDLERARQLYVAMTRARTRLHLLGQVMLDQKGEPSVRAGTMLAGLWPQLSPQEKNSYMTAIPRHQATEKPRKLQRLPLNFTLPPLPEPVGWHGAGPLQREPHEPSFEWVGQSLRHVGTVVHGLLQRMAGETVAVPDIATIRQAVAHAGVVPAEVETAAQRVRDALGRVLKSERCRWILSPHDDARSEYAVAGVVKGEIMRGTVDRTFVENGLRWIIDFKTSSHEGANVATFLDEQQRRYRDQMERYAGILAGLGLPVRLGLYFPLLDEWREWGPGRA